MLNSVNGVRAERRGRREDKQGHRREEGEGREQRLGNNINKGSKEAITSIY